MLRFIQRLHGIRSSSLLPYIEPQALKPQAYYALPAVRAYCESRRIEKMDDEAVYTSTETVHLHPVQPKEREQVFELLKRVTDSFLAMNPCSVSVSLDAVRQCLR